jgi:S-layer protein (TIGR01567 family)
MNKVILRIFTAILALGLLCGAAAAALPTATITANRDSGTAPLTVEFTSTNENATTLYWDFGDGKFDVGNNTIVSEIYRTAGTFIVKLTPSNSEGNGSTVTKTITVSSSELKSDFEATPTQGTIPLTVKFKDKSSGNPNAWSWNFGDGTNSTLQNPEHTYTNPGEYNITLGATNDSIGNTSTETKRNYIKVTAKDNSTGNRIWENGMPTTYTWTAQSFSGFYYDLDTGVSSETMTIKDIGKSIDSEDIEYKTTPSVTKFKHKSWGSYQLIGFMAEKYFAGYTSENSTVIGEDISPISDGILSKILIDTDDKKSASSGEALALEEGYSLNVKEVDVNGNSVWVQLEKDGKVVDDGFISSGKDYSYKTDLGKATDVPIIIVHFGSVFSGAESSAVFVQGIFQISENYQEVKNGDEFGKMEVKSTSSDGITMKNTDSVGLDKGDTIDLMGKVKIKVADDSTLRFAPIVDTTEAGTYELRGTVYDRTKDGDTYPTWTPFNFEGFYYNIDEGIGTESLNIKNMGSSTISDGDLIYQSKPQAVNFEHGSWGNFTVVGFMADKYFAGYPDGVVGGQVDRVSLLSDNILSKILTDSDDKQSMTSGSALALQEGYSLSIKEVDVNGNSVWVQLEKDGKVVDDNFISSNKDYVYKTDIGKAADVPLIIIHFGTVFSGAETSAVFVQGVFQISDEYTEINDGDDFDKMEVSSVSEEDGIVMKNKDSIGLDKGEETTFMGNVSFKTADDSTLRFYPFVKVQSGGSSAHGLNISVPDEIVAGSQFDIKVTADGDPVEGAVIKVNGNNTGNTSSDGIVQYTAESEGTLKLTAEKKGYSTVSKNLNVIPPKEEMSLSVTPEKIYIGDNITITALKKIGGDPIVGANITIDGQLLGETGSNGNISYKTDKNGTIKVSTSKKGFNSNSIDVNVRNFEAIFTVSSLIVTPKEVSAGKNATISATIVNTGNAAGNYTAALSINGNVTDSKEVSLGVGGNKTVTFSHREEKPGNYTAVLGEKTVTYTVKESSPILLYALGAVVLLIIGGAAYYFTKGGGDVGDIQEKVQELINSIKLKK